MNDFSDIDSVIDIFAYHIELNNGNETTQENVDRQFIIPDRSKLIPIVMLSVKNVNGVPTSRPFISLVDSGSTGCLFNRRAIPFGTETLKTTQSTVHTTTQGQHTCNEVVYLDDAVLPEFVNNRHIKGITCHVFNNPNCPYDVIVGRDFLNNIRMILDFQTDTLLWLN